MNGLFELPVNHWFSHKNSEVRVPIVAVKWLEIHQRVRKMIRSVFDSATAVHPEMHSPRSRAIYGVDVMLDRCFQPKLLEVCTLKFECQLLLCEMMFTDRNILIFTLIYHIHVTPTDMTCFNCFSMLAI